MKWFWFVLFFTIIIWYFFVSIRVAVKGLGNIREMLKTLEDSNDKS